jgi:hypothetical protein
MQLHNSDQHDSFKIGDYFFKRSVGTLSGLKPWVFSKFLKTASDERGSTSDYRKRKEKLDA